MEQIKQEEEKTVTVPLATKLGMIAVPLLPTLVIDALFHGGLTPPALIGFGLSYLSFEGSPKALAWLGENKPFLAWLAEHPETLRKVNCLSRNYFSQQLAVHHLAIPVQPKDASVEAMEPLQPRRAFDVGGKDVLNAPTFLPDGPIRFSDILKTFTPSLDKIYLATLPDGTNVFTSARALCHTALAGATRGGKDHLIRQLMSQLCYAGANVYLLDPNYKRYDLESIDPWERPYPEDWTPFEQHLKNDPRELIQRDRTYKVIEHYLKEACELVERRLEILGRSEQKLGMQHFIFINELPAIVDEVPNTAHYLKKILREGAKVGVFMVNASQDFQVGTVFKDIGGGIRKCYRTAFDVGAEPATQNALGLLPLKGRGKGHSSLRNDAVASEVRVPWVENDALYRLLGESTYEKTGQQAHAETILHPYQPNETDRMFEPRKATQTTTQEQPTRRRVATSGYEANRQRKAQESAIRREWHASAPKQAQVKQDEPGIREQGQLPEDSLKDDERQVLQAYRDGLKSGNAIAGMTGIAGTRVNQCLNKLSALGMIDWQPKIKS